MSGFVADKALVEIRITDAECGYLDLGIAAGDEVHVLAFGQLYFELFDKGSYVAVGDDGTFILLNA